MKIWKKILIGIFTIFVLISLLFVAWGETPAQPMPEALAALKSDATVKVTTGKWLVFAPTNGEYQAGFIFYPGGRVDYRAYAPMAHAIAAQGYLVVIPRMPLNLAVFGIERAADVMAVHSEVTDWVIGGHSLGGSMAANYLFQHPDKFSGLVFLASYPAESDVLVDYPGKVFSISGSLDGLATPAKILASKSFLSADTQFVEISGGNHAYFGWYGDQKGDNAATITRGEQQKIVDETVIEFLKNISNK